MYYNVLVGFRTRSWPRRRFWTNTTCSLEVKRLTLARRWPDMTNSRVSVTATARIIP